MSLIDSHNLQVCVHTTWWNKEEQKFNFYRGWPSGKKDSNPLQEWGDLRNMHDRKKKKPCVSVSLFQALTVRSSCSSYLVQYAPTSLECRLRQQALNPDNYKLLKGQDADGIQMILAIFDIDCHESENSNDWWNEQAPKLDRLLKDHPGLFVYQSKGGMRILGILPKPISIESHADADNWTYTYQAWCNYLARKYHLKTEGKETADKLADWTRFQRVPHDTRIKGQEPSEFSTRGDPGLVGTWEPQLEAIDWPVRSVTSHEHLEYEGECQLLQLVQLSGLQWEELAPGIFDIHCPAAHCHSDSAHRKTKTVLYTNGPIGKIECKSSTCQSLHPDKQMSYLKHFKPDLVVKTSKNWLYDPIVLKIQDRMGKRAGLIEWDTPADSPILSDQEYDEKLLKVAIREACFSTNIDLKEFSLWFVRQRKYKDPKDSEAKVAFLLHIDTK